ncbi:MAG: hypothetical protein ACHQIO_16950, partial [Nevskiales bacterium]
MSVDCRTAMASPLRFHQPNQAAFLPRDCIHMRSIVLALLALLPALTAADDLSAPTAAPIPGLAP